MKWTTQQVLLLVSLIVLIIGCKKETQVSNPPIDGIVMTDINGALIGSTDTNDDWQVGKEWSDDIDNLFEGLNLDLCNLTSDAINVIAYPNPTPDQIFISTQSDTLIKARHYRIVDQNFALVGSFDNVETQNILIDLIQLGGPGIYRAYFIIEFESGCIEKGFGDISVVE